MGHTWKLKSPYSLHAFYDNTYFRSYGVGKHSARIESRIADLDTTTKESRKEEEKVEESPPKLHGRIVLSKEEQQAALRFFGTEKLEARKDGKFITTPAVNVYMTNNNQEHQGRHDILKWINDRLGSNFRSVEELGSGAAYCQLMHMLFPSSVPMKRVRFQCAFDSDCVHNFEILQDAFHAQQVDKEIPVDKLVKGRFLANFEFLQWFKKFVLANHNGSPYNAIKARGGIPFAVQSKTSEIVWQSLSIIPNSNKTFTSSPQVPPTVDGTHRQSCQRGWYYSSAPRN